MKKTYRIVNFRGKRLDGGWAFGYLNYNVVKNRYEINAGGIFSTVRAETIGQSSGCTAKDINGKIDVPVYEGDILAVGKKAPSLYVVEWMDGAFRVITAEQKRALDAGINCFVGDFACPELLGNIIKTNIVRVVGNIHEDFDLLIFNLLIKKEEQMPPIPD